MPITEKITFKTKLTSEYRIKVPKNAIDHYKLETNQLLKITISVSTIWESPQTFLTKIRKDGKIRIPTLIMRIFESKKPNLEGHIVNVTIEPA
jgi:hypothetical protein